MSKTFKAWAVVRDRGKELTWVYVGSDARQEAVTSLNRPAGERAVPATVTLDPPKQKKPPARKKRK